MKCYKARGIVLHTVKYGESSLVLYLLTDTMGRQTYMVQGVRSSGGRKGKSALLQPMFVLDFVGLESPRMQMHRMKEISSALPPATIPFDVRKSTISLFMAELIYRLVRESEPNSPLFDFVYACVEALDGMEEGVANFHLWFMVRLASLLGFYPGNEHIPGKWFDIREGLFTPVMPRHTFVMEPENAQLLGWFMEHDAGALGTLKLAREQRSGFMTALLDYFGYHLDSVGQVKVRSIQILREVF